MIKEVDVKPIKEIFYCDECKSPVIYTNNVLTSHPPKFEHKCINCHKIYQLPFVYPKIEYIEI